MSRLKNSYKNLIASGVSQLIGILLKFVTRTIFIQILGPKYLGINGLFTNILSMLSLAELGVGAAITFNLYKPVAEKNIQQIVMLMRFYRNAYRVIGLFIAAVGLALIPFLPLIIKDDISFIPVTLIFILYLLQSVTSYLFFAYKSAIIKVNQKEYIITYIASVFSIIANLVQILLLLLFNNFQLYVITLVVFGILQNLFIAHKAGKLYPYINEQQTAILPKDERRQIRNNCFAISIYKFNTVIQNATDNIVLSTFIGLEIVGKYSNYLLIVTTIKNILNKFYTAIRASVGDLHAQGDTEHEHLIFRVVGFFTICVFGFASVATYAFANEFIAIWIGSEYVFSQYFTSLLAFEIYLFGLQKNLATFRTSMGLFQQAKYRPLFGSIINIVLSVILVQRIGIYGVLIGTIVASLTTYMWFDPLIIYRNVFRKSVRGYYAQNIKYFCAIVLSAIGSRFISKLLLESGLAYVLSSLCISLVITGTIIFVFFGRSEEFKYLMKLFKRSKVFKSVIRKK